MRIKSMYLNNKKVDVKLFLWGLFFLQLFLITIFIIFGSLFVNSDDTNTGQISALFNVKFISNLTISSDGGNQGQTSGNAGRNPRFQPIQIRSIVKLEKYSKYFRTIKYSDGYKEHQKLCFIEGTHFYRRSRKRKHNETESEENDILPDRECRCQAEWHGKDCGQPEVLWRAFMTSKIPLNMTASVRQIPKNIFYIIQTTFLSIEVLEIQIMELIDVVNLFILCDLQQSSTLLDNYSIAKHVTSTGFLKTNQHKLLIVEDSVCSGRNIYRKIRKFVNKSDINVDDILIYSKTDEILNRKAVNYFRWYDNWPQPVRFRLKYSVYGFFWQHPENTVIGSVACQLNILDEVYKSDPEKLLTINKPVMIIGDLNHYGGWFCQYCYQPIDIVKNLEFIALTNFTYNNDSRNQSASYLPNSVNTKILNEEYVQNLISNGKYLDNRLNLIKLHRHSDKYYSPDYVRNNSWRFDNIVINLFARWDDNVEDDEYFN